MSRTIADLMAETLRVCGVQRIYGVVGDSLNGFTDSLCRQKTIEWVHMRHEEAAAFAAGEWIDVVKDAIGCSEERPSKATGYGTGCAGASEARVLDNIESTSPIMPAVE